MKKIKKLAMIILATIISQTTTAEYYWIKENEKSILTININETVEFKKAL